jgi:transcriptional regulator with XRE-family HTH domain
MEIRCAYYNMDATTRNSVEMSTHFENQLLDSVLDKETGRKDRTLLTLDGRPLLRLVKSEELLLCNSNSLSAASPRGSFVRPVSMSLIEEAANPTRSPISASVIPIRRSADMRTAHVVMPSSLLPAVDSSQLQAVTEVRHNGGMARPLNLPRFTSIGQRVRWWREHRGISRSEFAKKVPMPYSTLSELELDRSQKSMYTHLIAAALRLNPHYLETDQGEPEANSPQEPPPKESPWPFDKVSRAMLSGLSRVERSHAEAKLLEALAEIQQERRQAKRSG